MLEVQGLNPAPFENTTSLPQSARGFPRSRVHHQISELSDGGRVKPKKEINQIRFITMSWGALNLSLTSYEDGRLDVCRNERLKKCFFAELLIWICLQYLYKGIQMENSIGLEKIGSSHLRRARATKISSVFFAAWIKRATVTKCTVRWDALYAFCSSQHFLMTKEGSRPHGMTLKPQDCTVKRHARAAKKKRIVNTGNGTR